MEAVGKLVVNTLLGLLNSIYNAFVLMLLWDWFIVKAFDLPPLSIGTALGFNLIVYILTLHELPKKSDSAFWERVVLALITSTIFLAFGFFYKTLFGL